MCRGFRCLTGLVRGGGAGGVVASPFFLLKRLPGGGGVFSRQDCLLAGIVAGREGAGERWLPLFLFKRNLAA